MRLGYVATLDNNKTEIRGGEGAGAAARSVVAGTQPAAHACSILATIKNLIAKTMAPVTTEDSMHKDKEENRPGKINKQRSGEFAVFEGPLCLDRVCELSFVYARTMRLF